MIKKILIIQLIFILFACSQQEAQTVESINFKTPKINSKFFYSVDFSKIYDIKLGTKVLDWDGIFALSLDKSPDQNSNTCVATLYLGNNINFDYPQQGDFVNITAQRYDDIFHFTPDVTDEDARIQAKRIILAANKIAIRGYKDKKITASMGFSIDYILKNAVNNMTVIKTQSSLCNVLQTKDYDYYLLLKPKGIDKSADFLKFKLPLNR